MKVVEFNIEESKVSKGRLILVATDEAGNKFVMSGDHWNPTYLIKYEKAFDTSLSIEINEQNKR